ncbi:AAA family ATPase [Staphylococcus capitis]|uniref:ATP-dependent Clp protease ATP-binding subunit n=2 Tax=Staphylococcus capitis TaxID=29388 RepID=A0ABX1SNV7_STACP|nr:AAA family ATPase [Staphylococcus capitis]NMK53988.1 ATP-dependent Clp protease ATP-binding subunit [Staphylococcus capitis]NMK69319.1 ATP-dependent Clp protease ATP-binding subunit [Staphylococcus capitis]
MSNKILCPDLFKKINEDLGNSLTILESNKTVIGREEEMNAMKVILNKKERPVAFLVGGQGTGKSALARAYMNDLKSEGIHVEMFQLKIGMMGSDANELKARMNILLEKMKEYKDEALKKDSQAKIILFIDEVHTVISVFGENTKIGGDLLKESLAEAEKFINVIVATTLDEYLKYIADDFALDRRLNRITIKETSPSLTLNILKDWLVKITKESDNGTDYTKLVSDHLLKRIIQANRAYNEKDFEPAKSIDVLSTLISYSEVNGVPPSEKTLAQILKSQYRIELGFSLDPYKIMDYFKSRIKGQPLATAEYDRVIKSIAFQLYPDRNRPRGKILAVGTTGTGKTEACKTLAYGMFKDRNAYVHISLTDYSDSDGARRLLVKIGKSLEENPNAIILLDEIDKGTPESRNILLPLLDEGRIKYETIGRDGTVSEHTVKATNAIIIATSNAGAELMKEIQNADDESYLGEDLTPELKIKARDMVAQVKKTIGDNILKPEFIARFDSVIPFRTLEDDTLLGLANRQMRELLERVYDEKGMYIQLPPIKDWSETSHPHKADAISMYIVKERMGDNTSTESKGAREIENVINEDILSEIIEAYYKYPETKRFIIDTNGESMFENSDTVEKRGLIEVKPEH